MVCIDDEIPFEIPDTWRWCKVKQILEIGSARRVHQKDWRSSGIPFYRAREIGKLAECGHVDNELFIDHDLYKEFSISGVPVPGDLMVTAVGTLGKVYIVKNEDLFYYKDASVLCLNNRYNLNPSYLKHVIESPMFVNQFVGESQGTTVATLTMVRFNEYLIPIPPREEQNRIVNFINSLEPYIEKYSNAQTSLDIINKEVKNTLKKSILQEAIQGKLVPQDASEEPASILLQRIKDEKLRLVKEGKLKKKDVIDSTIFRGDDNKYYEQIDATTVQIETDYSFPDTWEVVRLAHICRLTDGEKKEGNYVCLDAKYLRGKSSGDIQPKGKFVSTGDNIILVDGENSGEVFSVPHDGYMGSTFKQLWVSGNMHLPYVLYFIQFYKDLLRNSKKGAAIPHLNKEIFYSLLIGIPPYQEQARIVQKINKITNEIKGN